MKIVHFAPFAPQACGLYEAARDMVRADMHMKYDVHLVDTGIVKDGKRLPGKIGVSDNRGDKNIITSDPKVVLDADIIVAHTGVSDNWLVKCQAPIIWIIHGRPLATFRPEQNSGRNSYSLLAELATWPRVKAMLTFWDYHVQFWDHIVPKEKLVCFDAPPIDERRFAPEGRVHDYKAFKGRYNIMIAESWREDIDIYEITHGVLLSAGLIEGLKYHFYAMEIPKQVKCWNVLIEEMRKRDIKGEIYGRIPQIEESYRSADILLSPQRIVTRSIGEALSCGTPVIAAKGNKFATWTMRPDEPKDVAMTIKGAINDIKNRPEFIKKKVREAAEMFSLNAYNLKMKKLYEQVA